MSEHINQEKPPEESERPTQPDLRPVPPPPKPAERVALSGITRPRTRPSALNTTQPRRDTTPASGVMRAKSGEQQRLTYSGLQRSKTGVQASVSRPNTDRGEFLRRPQTNRPTALTAPRARPTPSYDARQEPTARPPSSTQLPLRTTHTMMGLGQPEEIGADDVTPLAPLDAVSAAPAAQLIRRRRSEEDSAPSPRRRRRPEGSVAPSGLFRKR